MENENENGGLDKEKLAEEMKKMGFENIEFPADDGVEMGSVEPKDLIPDSPGSAEQLVSQRDGPPVGAVRSEIPPLPESKEYHELRKEERRKEENELFHDVGMTRADYEQMKKTVPPKSFKRISQARFETPPETDVDKALSARLEKSPETVEAFKRKCEEIKAFYDCTSDGPAELTMGRHRAIVPTQAIAEARYSLPPRPAGLFSRILYDTCAFIAKSSLGFLNWFMRPTINKQEQLRVNRINALIEKLASEMTTDNPETKKSWEQVSAVRGRMYEVKSGETEEEARERELDEIANAYDSSLWGDGKDSASIMATTSSWKRVESDSGRYSHEYVESQFASQLHDKKVNVEDTIIVSPKLIDDPVLLRSKELKIASLRKKKMLTIEERNQLDELTRSLR